MTKFKTNNLKFIIGNSRSMKQQAVLFNQMKLILILIAFIAFQQVTFLSSSSSSSFVLSADRRHFNHNSHAHSSPATSQSSQAHPSKPIASASTDGHNHHNDQATNTNSNQDSNTNDQEVPSAAGGSSYSDGAQDSGGESSESPYQAPFELEAIRISDSSIVLRWDIADIALHHLQFFKIQYKLTKKDADWKTENKEILPTTKAYQINGLKPGAYFFVVAAVYDNDDHVSSEQFKYKLRARSKIPADDMPEQRAPIIHWSESQSDYIRFKWKYQFKEKDVQDFGYLVYYRSAHQISDFVIYNTLDENVEIVDLEPDTPYEAKVVAYNKNGVSDFSETKQIKTKSKANSTTTTATPNLQTSSTTIMPNTITTPTSTTKRPQLIQMIGSTLEPSINISDSIAPQKVTPPPVGHLTTNMIPLQTTPKPTTTTTAATVIVTVMNNSNSTSNSNSTYYSFANIVDLIVGGNGQSDTTLAIRYSIIVLLPILFIVFATVCLISCHHRRKDSPASSTHDSMQFDLEINGYIFKNSFPGVEKEYSSTTNHHAHHGFVNNHPHINDFP